MVEARALGFLGPGPIEAHIDHALGFAAASPHGGRALDLGSGAGIPGLVLALLRPDQRWVLLDAHGRRTRFLERAVLRLGLSDRVIVHLERAEDAGRRAEYRGGFELVVARSFGPPAVTAECGAPFLAVGGRLVVSEPPDVAGQRWPETELAQLGLRPGDRLRAPAAYQVLEQVAPCPARFPRRAGVPGKRPLFVSRETSAG